MNERLKNESKTLPPKWATKLLHWYCDPDLVEEIDGDLLESFDENCQQNGILLEPR